MRELKDLFSSSAGRFSSGKKRDHCFESFLQVINSMFRGMFFLITYFLMATNFVFMIIGDMEIETFNVFHVFLNSRVKASTFVWSLATNVHKKKCAHGVDQCGFYAIDDRSRHTLCNMIHSMFLFHVRKVFQKIVRKSDTHESSTNIL